MSLDPLMCGIAGILSGPSVQPPQRGELAAMIGRLHHRGPDGSGFFVDRLVGLAHARLAIIDVAGGDQPIFNEDGSVAVVFNGEIFDYVELRAELEARGHRFRTRSDTEVLVHLYEEHGERFVERLNGQFAIALWDARRERLVLARDRTGIRPLFHVESGGRVAFASEVKALFALPDVARELDPRALAEICTYWSCLPPRSAFAGISSVPPGCVLVFEGGDRRLRRYWDWEFPEAAPQGRPDASYAEELRALLADSVRLQLRSDVPVGTYLSGGLDSAITTALAKAETRAALRTFSLTFEDPEFDESAYQRALVRHLGTEHTSIAVRRGDIAAAFPRTILHTESPILRTAPTPLMLLAEQVRSAGFKVVLTGEGADEVFGGYDLFKEASVRRFWARAPGSRWRHRLLERLYPWLRNSPATGRAFTEAFFREGLDQLDRPWFAHLPRWSTTGRISRFFSAELRSRVGEWNPRDAFAATLPQGIERWLPLGRDQYVEAHTLMTGYLLSSQGDRVAMAHSVEGRFPFLDHRVIEFANRLPPRLKLRGLTEKYILRRATADLLPPEVSARVKQPYRAPDSSSFFAGGRPVGYVAELFTPAKLAAAGYFDAAAAGRLLAKCAAGRAIGFADNMAFVCILSTMLLHEQLILGNTVDAGDAGHSSRLAA